MIHGKKARPIQKDGTLQRVLVGGPQAGPAPAVLPWVDPPGASTCNEPAAFSSGCASYLVGMIHGKMARPIQKDGTLQRLLVGGPGPAPAVGHPWVGPPGASTCNEHAAFSSGCAPYLVRMIHGKMARPIQKDGTLQRVLVGGPQPAPAVGRPARRFHMQGTCGLLIGLRPVPSANDPRRKRLSDRERRDLTARAGGWTWARATRGSTRQALPHARHMRLAHRTAART